jgi:hypothetical protein
MVSREMFEFYGVGISYVKGCEADRLAAFLQRQKKLAVVVLCGEAATIPALCQAIAQGCCLQVKELDSMGKLS